MIFFQLKTVFSSHCSLLIAKLTLLFCSTALKTFFFVMQMSGALREQFLLASFILEYEVLQHLKVEKREKKVFNFHSHERRGIKHLYLDFYELFFSVIQLLMFTFAFLRFLNLENEQTSRLFFGWICTGIFGGSFTSAHVQEFLISSRNSLDCNFHEKNSFRFSFPESLFWWKN